ncbi:fatty acid desaturase [soil metagenome]
MDAPIKTWTARLAAYRHPDNFRAIIELTITFLPFALCWYIMWALLAVSYWLTLLVAIPTAGLLVRLFMIQHDCGHGALFSHRSANDWIGRVLGVLTLTPYDHWRKAHALHHAGSGNLDKRGIGDIDTLTVREYLMLKLRGRLRYRLYRHPVVMFGLGPAYLFILRHRVPAGAMNEGRMPWVSTMATNLGIVIAALPLVYALGLVPFLLIQVPLILLAASAGVWLFYVQHQFEQTHWVRNPDWQHSAAALHGSSYYDLPPVLMWFTGNIGIHHLHHLSSRIPFYRLPQVLKEYPELKQIGRLTIWESLRCVPLTLWDEKERRLISFRRFWRERRASALA